MMALHGDLSQATMDDGHIDASLRRIPSNELIEDSVARWQTTADGAAWREWLRRRQ